MCNVKAEKEMLLVSAKLTSCGSLEDCHMVIAMSRCCQQESSKLDSGEVITPPWVARRKSDRLCLSLVIQCMG